MKFRLPAAVTAKVARQVLVTKKHSPTILFGAGVVGMVATTVTACRATLKLETLVTQTQQNLDTARTLQHKDYSEQDRQKDKLYIYTQAAAKLTRLYGPSVVLGVVSIACLTKSHNILTERNAGLAAALTAVSEGFEKYRSRVREELGEEKDLHFRYGSESKTVVEQTSTGEKKRKVTRVGPDEPGIYARFFDEYSPAWKRDPELNYYFIRCQQNWANDKLQAQRHLFLNEVYDLLGLPRTKAGAVVGWVLDTDAKGFDPYVDFGIFTGAQRDEVRDFVNGRERSILLDFNVGGPILDLI